MTRATSNLKRNPQKLAKYSETVYNHIVAEKKTISDKALVDYCERVHYIEKEEEKDDIFISKATIFITLSLASVWVAFHIASLLFGGSYIEYVYAYGLIPADTSGYKYLTSIFIHGNFVHLFVNSIALIAFGGVLHKHLKDTKKFVLFFLVTGIITLYSQVIAFSYVGMNPEIPLVGASGAVCALFGYFGLARPNKRIDLFLVFIMKAKNGVSVLLVLSLAVVFYFGFGAGGIAHTAHITGLIIGILTAIKMGKTPDKLPILDSDPFFPFRIIYSVIKKFSQRLITPIKLFVKSR